VADTTQWFTQSAWLTKKVYMDGAEQPGHFLINSGYKFNKPDSYIFSIPNFPSAFGAWVFAATGKGKVELTTQAGVTTWTILSISVDKMVIETTESNGKVFKYNFEH
jgi:hypothetical protein